MTEQIQSKFLYPISKNNDNEQVENNDIIVKKQESEEKLEPEQEQESDQDQEPEQEEKLDQELDQYQESEQEEKLDHELDQYQESEEKLEPVSTNRNFYYLEDGDLDHDFGLCQNVKGSSFSVYICGYTINENSLKPFLQFLMEKEAGYFTFPHFDFTCPENIESESENTPEHVYFQNKCIDQIMQLMDLDGHSDENALNDIYKGFTKEEYEDETFIFAIFDFTGLTLKPIKEPIRTWAIMDEIINRHTVFELPIEEKVFRMFYNNPELLNLKDLQHLHIENPYLLYSCVQDNNVYKNVYHMKDQDFVSLLHERIHHPFFGNFFVFSMLPFIPKNDEIFEIKRFAGFVPNPMYILKDISPFFKEMVGATTNTNTNTNTITDTIASIPSTIMSRLGFNGGESEEEKVEEEKVEEEIVAKLNPTDIKREINDANPSCIYFQDNINDNRIPFWCIKSSNNFILL